VDAAALAASTQFKKNVETLHPEYLQNAASEFLALNGVSSSNPGTVISITTCKLAPTDAELCPPGMKRKLVRVTVKEDAPLFFISLIPGAPKTMPIQVSSISEAAAIDLVLIIDRSESMGYFSDSAATIKWPKNSINGDPVSCNTSTPASAPDNSPGLWTGNCHPFHEVKSAAYSFVETFLDEQYDRVGIVVFDHDATPVNWSGDPNAPIYLSDNRTQIENGIRNLWMYDGFHNTGLGEDKRSPIVYDNSTHGMVCPFVQGLELPGYPLCRLFDAGHANYYGFDCEGFRHLPQPDGTLCGTTDIGRGLEWAARIFGLEGRRESALWVSILLTDGVPNAGYSSKIPASVAVPICPNDEKTHVPFCRDTDSSTRHAPGTTEYDTDDYARDAADLLADGSAIFSIGLGDQVTSDPFQTGPEAAGVSLLNYIAKKGETTNYYQANADDLQKIFRAIANKIATRLTQ
jgi:hypothetical protein